LGAWYNEDTGKEITENKEIPYEENYIRIRYAALNFKSEKEIEFFYRLEPVSPQWKPAPAGIIEFRSLAPGTYRFEVSSIESNRRSSENSAVLIFTVAPPFYLRAEFVLITVLLILLAFWWLISLKTKKMRERNILLNTEVKKRTKDLEGKNIQLQEVVSKLQRTQAQLVHSEKMASLGLLSAGLAHEVRNPVSFTVTNALYLKGELQDLLREKEVDKEDALRIKEMLSSLDAICEGSKRVEQVVNNLQSFASPQEAEYKRVNLNQNLESTLKLIKARYAKRIDFELRFAPDLPSIYCYPSLLNQVFLNLLINAIHAIPETGKITIATSVKKNDFIEISVADTGEGIPEEVRERIFDPFFTTKPVGTGTGLGLAISHSIITGKHKGKILFESEVGKGTVFRVLIPSNLPAKPDQDER
jgi:signal transduction histidine kinase